MSTPNTWTLAQTPAGGIAAAGDIGIAMAALVNSDPLAGLAGAPLFAMMGSYIAFFHTPKVHAWHIALVTTTVVGLSTWLAIRQGHDGVWLAVSKGGVALMVSIGLLPLLHYGFWIMQRSFVDSLSDPLTGLTNRRGLDEVTRRLIADRGPDVPVSALWIDLDGFKAVNDTHGHLAGDAVLRELAALLRDEAKDGFSAENGFITDGFSSIAVAARNHLGIPVAAIALTFRSEDADETLRGELAGALKAAGLELSKRLGGH